MPRKIVSGGVIDIKNGTQKISWGTGLNTLTPLTMAFWVKLRAAGSSSYDVVWGFSNQRAFFILDGVSTRRMRFSVFTSSVERSSGLCAALTLDTWYFVVGGYDPSAGTGNLFIRVYNSDGSLFDAPTPATVTGALDTAGATPLVFGSDTVKNPDQPIDAQGTHFRIYNRLLTSTDCDNLAVNQISRENLVLETLCNEASSTTQTNTGINIALYTATISGGALVKAEPPSEIATSRQAITARQLLRDSGTALLFAGGAATDRVTITSVAGLDFTDNFTLTAWINPRSFGASNVGRIFNKDSVAAGYSFLFAGATKTLQVFMNNTTLVASSSTNIIPAFNKWYHVAVTYQKDAGSNQLNFYVNGSPAGTGTYSTSLTASTDPLYLGNNRTTHTRSFDGILDEMSAYNVTLTAAQISTIYFTGRYPALGLQGLWRFDEGSGSSATDSSGNNNTGTITGATYSTNVVFKPRTAMV